MKRYVYFYKVSVVDIGGETNSMNGLFETDKRIIDKEGLCNFLDWIKKTIITKHPFNDTGIYIDSLSCLHEV
jgi:hypothetical protein